MATWRTVKTLLPTDAAYIAGIIDGEGTVSNTEIQLLDYLIECIGAGKTTRKRITLAHHTPSFTYAIYNRQAITLLQQIHQYMQSYKAERTRLILEQYIQLTPRNGKYTDEKRAKRTLFENTVLAIEAT